MQAAKEILSGVFQFSVGKSSVFLLVEDQVTVIDAGWALSGPSILQCLGRLGRSPEDISHIVATHYHTDHIGGLAHLREKSAGRVAVHSAEVPFVQGEKPLPNPFQSSLLALLMTPILIPSRPTPVKVDLPLNDGDCLSPLGGMKIIHSPGHTPGSISLYFPKKALLIVGDALEHRNGRLGLPSSHFTENMDQAKQSIQRLARLEFDVLCFSHFPPICNGAMWALRGFAESLD